MTNVVIMTKKPPEKEFLELTHDIYTYTFFRYLNCDNPMVHKDLIKRSLMTFFA